MFNRFRNGQGIVKSLFATSLLFSTLPVLAAFDPASLPPAATNTVDFARDIQPILERSCLKCHSGEKPKGKFLLTTRDMALKGGQDQVDIISGQSAKSTLIQFVARVISDSEMPPTGKGDPLAVKEVGLLRAWIDQGVVWPTGIVLGQTVAAAPHLSTNSLPAAATQTIDFVRDVQPILSQSCYECHGPKKQESQLRWDNKETAMQGGEHGPVIIPGKSAESRMIQ